MVFINSSMGTTEALQHFYSPILRLLSGFIGFMVVPVFGVFPNEIFGNFSEYWWTILFWIPAVFINKQSLMRKKNKRIWLLILLI